MRIVRSISYLILALFSLQGSADPCVWNQPNSGVSNWGTTCNSGVGGQPNGYVLDVFQGSTGGFRVSDGGGLGLELRALSSTQTRLLSYNRTTSSYGDLLLEHSTGAGGTIFKTSGRVGIGESDPDAMLHVGGDGFLTGRVGIGRFGSAYALDVDQLVGGSGLRLTNNGAAGIELAVETTDRTRLLSYNRTSSGYVNMFFEHASGARGMLLKNNGDVEVGVAPAVSGTPSPVTFKVNGNIEATGTIYAKFQDVAEWVPSTEDIPAGSVVIVAAQNHVIASSEAYDTRVAGVVSPQPGIVLGEAGDAKVLVATTGRVKVRVDASNGPIREGDLLVSSPVKGTAMKSEPLAFHGRSFHQPGTLIGKALEPLEKGTGEILVLLSLQ